jgi:hypothetical protein
LDGPPKRTSAPRAESSGARSPRPVSRGERSPSAAAQRSHALERRTARRGGRGALERTGNKLGLAFWQAVSDGTRWPRKKVVRDSPLSALYRLYGSVGPLCALGLPPGQWPSRVTAATYPRPSGFPHLTSGDLVAGETSYPYALYWWLEAGKPVVGEVLPTPHPAVIASAAGGAAAHDRTLRLRDWAPSPSIELDPVAAALWRTELPGAGLSIAVRCLATWWRLQDTIDGAHSPSTTAAAVAGAVARAAGMRRGRLEAAEAYAADAAVVDRVAREHRSELRLDRDRGW